MSSSGAEVPIAPGEGQRAATDERGAEREADDRRPSRRAYQDGCRAHADTQLGRGAEPGTTMTACCRPPVTASA